MKKVRKLLAKIHLLLGLFSGFVVFVVGITGSIWVFHKEITAFFNPIDVTTEHPSNKYLPTEELVSRAEASFDGQFRAQGIIMKGKHKAITVQFLKASEAKHTFQWYGNSLDYFYWVHLNPYSGKILKIENTQWEFFHVVQMIHTTLFLGHVGTKIISFSVLAFVILLFTGIVLWWPRNKKSLKMGTWFRWKSSTKWKRKNYDFHKILGFYSAWISVVIAITGLVWAFKWVDSSVQWLANGGQKIVSKPAVYEPTSTIKTVHNGLDKIFDSIPKQYPNATYVFIGLPKDSVAPYYTFVREHENINEYIAAYDQYSGERVELSSFDKLSTGEKFRSLNYSIHVGSILGLPGKILAFFASLISASLPVTGFMIWWGRRKRKRAPTQNSALPKMAKPIPNRP